MIERVRIRDKKYETVLKRQEEEFKKRIVFRKRKEPLPEDIVFFVEHQPVYTLGRHADDRHLLLPEAMLKEKGIETMRIERGGDITYHGPGQLTVYPILDMQRYGLGVKDYVDLLEETVILTLRDYGILGERIEGKTGVWIGKDTVEERKISAIGIKCSRYVCMHGVALNVSSDMTGFAGIVPCGLRQGVTSISLETGREVDFDEVEEKVWLYLTGLLVKRIKI